MKIIVFHHDENDKRRQAKATYAVVFCTIKAILKKRQAHCFCNCACRLKRGVGESAAMRLPMVLAGVQTSK